MCAVNGLCDPFIFFCFCGCLQAYNCPCKILLMLKNTTNDEFQCQVFNIHNAAQMWAERKKRDGWLYSLRIWSESRGCDSVRAWTHWLCVRMWRAGGGRVSWSELPVHPFLKARWSRAAVRMHALMLFMSGISWWSSVCTRVEMRRDEMLQWPHRNAALCLWFIPEVWDESGVIEILALDFKELQWLADESFVI